MGILQHKFKHYFKETKSFSYEDDFILLHMGGSAGHMQHPFDLPQVNSGEDLLKVFEYIRDNIKSISSSIKIDGLNVACRVANGQWVLDRGSMKPLDVQGISKDKLIERFGVGHGLVAVGAEVLDVMNNALPHIKAEVSALGLDRPTRVLNMEYVSGTSNVISYADKFLAIHGVLEFTQVTARRREAHELHDIDHDILKSLIQKLDSSSQSQGFKVVSQIPAKNITSIDFEKVLNQQIPINWGSHRETLKLHKWLKQASNPRNTQIIDVNGIRTPAMNRKFYLALMNGEAVNTLVNDIDANDVVSGAIMYHATRVLGRAILKSLDSDIGNASSHEGIVIRDDRLSPSPVKITGDFIVNGMKGKFSS